MWGRLILSNKRFAFVEQRAVEEGRIRKTQRIETVGYRINIPREKVLGSQSEGRTRKTGTFSKENYNVLIVAMETEQGIENPVFQVSDPSGWVTAIQRIMGGEVISTGTGARTCKYCGKSISDRDKFCSSCGKSQS
jgi:rRNA maturation endonuclease Nob1